MSQDVDRNQVFQTIRVRTPLKDDVSWIQKSKEKKDQNDARTAQESETKSLLLRQSSYVLSTTKKFENSANQANGEDIQPKGSTVETTDDAKPQAKTEEVIQNGEGQPEKSTAENKEECADAGVDQSGAAEVSADVHVELSVSPAKENQAAESPVEPTEQPVADTTAENKGENADTTVCDSSTEHNEAKASADAHVEDLVAEICAAAGTEESKDGAEALAAPAVAPKPQEESSAETEPVKATNVEDSGEASTVECAVENCEKCSEQAAEEVVEAVAEAVVDSSPDKSVVVDATPEEAAAQDNGEPLPDLVAESECASHVQPGVEIAAEGSCETQGQAAVETVAEVVVESSPETSAVSGAAGEEKNKVEPAPDVVAESVSPSPVQPAAESCETQEQAAVETVEAVAEVVVESSSETPIVPEAAGEEAVLIVEVEPAENVVTESVSPSAAQPAAEIATAESCETHEQAAVESVEAVAEAVVESSSETPAVSDAAQEEPAAAVVAESVSPSPAQPQEQAAVETVEAVVEVNVESSPEPSAKTDAAGEEAALHGSVEPVLDSVAGSVSEPQTASETAVKPAEVEPVASAEPVLQTRAEEVAECEVQPTESTVVEQSLVANTKSAADSAVQLKIEDAVEPEIVADADDSQDKFTFKLIELTDALDVEPPAAEPAPEPLKDPEQAPTEETNLKSEEPDHTSISKMPTEEKPAPEAQYKTRNGKAVCEFCDQTIDGNVTLTFSEPLVKYHPECLKCGVCAVALGDLLTPMFLLNQVIQCQSCFAKAPKT